MRAWTHLDSKEREQAIEKATNRILEAVVEGAIRFDDKLNRNTVQADIDAAIEKANKMRTPWFAGEYVYEAVGETLRGMGSCDAEDAWYPGPTESIIRL